MIYLFVMISKMTNKIVKTVFFCDSNSIFFEIELTVVYEKRIIYFEKYKNRYSHQDSIPIPSQ